MLSTENDKHLLWNHWCFLGQEAIVVRVEVVVIVVVGGILFMTLGVWIPWAVLVVLHCRL